MTRVEGEHKRPKVVPIKDGADYEILEVDGAERFLRRKPVTSDLLEIPIPGAGFFNHVEISQGMRRSFENSRVGQSLKRRNGGKPPEEPQARVFRARVLRPRDRIIDRTDNVIHVIFEEKIDR